MAPHRTGPDIFELAQWLAISWRLLVIDLDIRRAGRSCAAAQAAVAGGVRRALLLRPAALDHAEPRGFDPALARLDPHHARIAGRSRLS